MYLKSIEVHGFKSFANKIVFQFHNGITAIVGPNGSGKSNVADAVRWVLGEQSAKSLRGASMQDVIFSGTETRKPMGYASVSITLDNSDHKLAVSYDEVTVTRRVYRSGESEYLLNGTQVRLKDINELFYDTGIGKEGYSIIGQGQIEKILSGKPEERRELFDEAAGIVKFKRRKITAQKKLDAERQNLVRVNDILTELTRQLGPMQKQAETARIYLQKRDELKTYDVNLFLLEFERILRELLEVQEKQHGAESELEDTRREYEKTRAEYEVLETEIEQLNETLQSKKDEIAVGQLRKQQFENQIQLLREQINTAKASEEHLQSRIISIDQQLAERTAMEADAERELQDLRKELETVTGEEQKASQFSGDLKDSILLLEQTIEKGKSDIIGLLNQRATVKARMQRYTTMLEQIQIRKAQLSQEALKLKSEEAEQEMILGEVKREYDEVSGRIAALEAQSDSANEKLSAVQQKLTEANRRVEGEQAEYHRESSRLESLKNIAERYDGYGNSIRRIMEQKVRNPGILGVVADIIKVEKEYEVAIETALGGSIQNIVTDTEETAKRQIEYLKKNKFGRATFLPLSGISGKGGFSSPQALKEPGVVGLASSLVHADERYGELIQFLLGKTVVADQIDNAIALAGKYRHSLRIVTKDGELLSPGGSMSGGAFKNSSNLLGRRREIEELERQVKNRGRELGRLQNEIDLLRTDRNGLRDQIVTLKDELQKEYIAQNTAKMKLGELESRSGSTSEGYRKIKSESGEIDQQIREILDSKEKEQQLLAESEKEEKEIGQMIAEKQEELEEKRNQERDALADTEAVHLKLSQLNQKEQFIRQNRNRIRQEKEQLTEERNRYETEMEDAGGSVLEKNSQITELEETILQAASAEQKIQTEIARISEEKEKKSAVHKKFFTVREDLSERISLLDRENFRLNAQIEKMTEQKDGQINYMWEEYGLTSSAAQELRDESYTNAAALKKSISALKSEIKSLGNVNVNAIEDYKELSERHTFLSSQHEDLLKAEAALMKIIEELDQGMRTQFKEQFARIQAEFDKAFKQLFGGGRGTLELVEEEDILEAGIRIIAQPPGKKLQNMMQLSGGEKSLTAIALLFAIQNLKPSPFCLLDEIEAALDESNVDRYAGYLHKLTKNTQFIIITHRRGTMTAADRLYGITMQEKGVSALVSVNLIEDDLDE
ncbi:MAG: chromosome segregation protein SMC [Candidatus Choladocola sp.]|nr:chromosome segregation protein SMC [Candidatus Choladocola sp.]